jgi:hypothetical protein
VSEASYKYPSINQLCPLDVYYESPTPYCRHAIQWEIKNVMMINLANFISKLDPSLTINSSMLCMSLLNLRNLNILSSLTYLIILNSLKIFDDY